MILLTWLFSLYLLDSLDKSFCRTSVQALMAFRLSIEKSSVILIGLSLYVVLSFPLEDSNILSWFCGKEIFFSEPVY